MARDKTSNGPPQRSARGTTYCDGKDELNSHDGSRASAATGIALAGADGLRVSLTNGSPIDKAPKGRNVIWTAVLVIEVVRVFPHVEAQQRGAATIGAHARIVLVGC
jgi:hypothetical protein